MSDNEELYEEEDYDPRIFEEQNERAQFVRGNEGNEPELTAVPANLTQQCKASKLHADAIKAGRAKAQ